MPTVPGPTVETDTPPLQEYRPESATALLRRIDPTDLARPGAVVAFAVAAALTSGTPTPPVLIIALAAVGLLIGCWPILSEAVGDLRHRRMSMELSMLIAILAAALIGEWVTSLVITAFVLAAEILEDLSMDRGRDALTDLMSFLPTTVQVRRDGQLQTVELAQVQPGHIVMVRPGGSIPVDGTVVEGRSSVDQSRITGEPLPVDVEPGSPVFAGSINQAGAVAVRAEQVGAESSYGQIVATVQAAQASEAPVQRLADRIAGYLVYLALAGAGLTYLITHDLRATISVVIVAGACGVAAGTPLAVLAAIARTARSGAFIKDGTHLEVLSAVDVVVFDKTGTLTVGRPEVTAVTANPGFSAEQVLAAAAAAEHYSEHPLAQAIVDHAGRHCGPVALPQSFENQPGLGVTALVDGQKVAVGNSTLVPGAEAGTVVGTSVRVALDGRHAGTIWLADAVRDSAADAVDRLQHLGLEVVMMTGDNQAAADHIATRLGITAVHAGLMPTQKVSLIGSLTAAGRTVAMVGDGVNDAPALAVADVGIAMGNGTRVARESADIVLISSDLHDLVSSVRTARRARRIITANVVGTIALDLVGIALAAVGLLGPLAAAIVHVGSESAFILNSARLIPSAHRRSARPARR